MDNAMRLGACVITCLSTAALAQVDFTGSYVQDFNGLGQSGAETIPGRGPHAIRGVLGSVGVVGWFGANFFGSSSNTEFKAHNGSLAGSSGRGVISFGHDGSGERALGTLATSNQISSFGIVLVNATGDTIKALDIAFVGEQWRAGDSGLSNTLNFSYGLGDGLEDATTGFGALDFVTPNLNGGEIAIDGNDPVNQVSLQATLGGLDWTPGASMVLRWDGIDLSGQDNGLSIDDLSIETGKEQEGVKGIDLSTYELVLTADLPRAAEEASGVTYNWETGRLFVIGDEGQAIVEITTTGELVSVMTLTGFEDTEGLTYLGDGKLVIVEERVQDVFLLTYVPGGSVDRGTLPGVSLGPTVGNIGLEGMSFDPVTGASILVKEKSPQGVYEVAVDWSMSEQTASDLFVPRLGTSDLSDVQVLSTVPDLIGTLDQDNLLILSQESALILEVTRSGGILSSFDFSSITGNAEGITIGSDGTIYVVGENPALYVLKPAARRGCVADLNGDGAVDGIDLGLLLGGWGEASAVDLSGDGIVDGTDLGIMLGAWGSCAFR